MPAVSSKKRKRADFEENKFAFDLHNDSNVKAHMVKSELDPDGDVLCALQVAQKRPINHKMSKSQTVIDEPVYFLTLGDLCAYLKPGKIQILTSNLLQNVSHADKTHALSEYEIYPGYIQYVL